MQMTLLKALKQNIVQLQDAISKTNNETAKNTASLSEQLKTMAAQTDKINESATRLTNVMRGANKVQGNWGELTLMNLLDSQGLRLGIDYDVQQTITDDKGNPVFNDESGKKMIPDVVSTSDAQHSADLNAQTVSAIAHLARLKLNDTQSAEYAQSLNKILGMMESLKGINTDDVEPLKSPFDHQQPLREDVVTEQNHREQYQAVAPAVQDGLFLVPRVIE